MDDWSLERNVTCPHLVPVVPQRAGGRMAA